MLTLNDLRNLLNVALVMLLSTCAHPVPAADSADCADNLPSNGEPYVVQGRSVVRICRIGYVSFYDVSSKTAALVVQRMSPRNAAKTAPRSGRFSRDPSLSQQESQRLADYANNEYDRGHLAPAEDFRWDPLAMRESFYTSNVVPQEERNNRGMWRSIEERVRRFATSRGEVFVYTGTIYACGRGWNVECDWMGQSMVKIPTHLFKVAYDPRSNETASFLVPNVDVEGAHPLEFLTSRADVESFAEIRLIRGETVDLRRF